MTPSLSWLSPLGIGIQYNSSLIRCMWRILWNMDPTQVLHKMTWAYNEAVTACKSQSQMLQNWVNEVLFLPCGLESCWLQIVLQIHHLHCAELKYETWWPILNLQTRVLRILSTYNAIQLTLPSLAREGMSMLPESELGFARLEVGAPSLGAWKVKLYLIYWYITLWY